MTDLDRANSAAAGLIRAARNYQDGQVFGDAIRAQCGGLDGSETAHVVGTLALTAVALHQGADLDRVIANLETVKEAGR